MGLKARLFWLRTHIKEKTAREKTRFREGPIVLGVKLKTYPVEFSDDVTHVEGNGISQVVLLSLNMNS